MRFILRRGIRPANAEILGVESLAAISLDARDPRALERADLGGSKCGDDYVEPLVWIVLVQTHLKILRRRIIPIQYRAPFDVEDAVRRATRHRRKNAASAGEAIASVPNCIGAHVLPQSEDGIVYGSPVK